MARKRRLVGRITNKLKPKYLLHYELKEIFSLGTKLGLFLNIILGIILVIMRDYPRALTSMDATFTFLTIVFLLFILPMILNGKIKAYYRYSYYLMPVVIFNIVVLPWIMSSVIRVPVTYGIHYLNHLWSDNPMDMVNYPRRLMNLLIYPKYNLIALTIFAFYIFMLFYQERFATVEEFSEGVLKIFIKRNRAQSYRKCVDEFNNDKLKQKYIVKKGEQELKAEKYTRRAGRKQGIGKMFNSKRKEVVVEKQNSNYVNEAQYKSYEEFSEEPMDKETVDNVMSDGSNNYEEELIVRRTARNNQDEEPEDNLIRRRARH